MLVGTRATATTHLATDRFRVEVLDYEWDVGTEVYETQPSLWLRWRIEPSRLDLPGRIGKSGVGNFGQLLLLPPQKALTSDGPAKVAGACRVVACQFEPEWLSNETGLNGNAFNDDLCMNVVNQDIEHAMRRLWAEIVRPGFAADLLSEGLAISIAGDLARHVSGEARPGDSSGKMSKRQLRMVLDYVADEQSSPPTISSVASHLGISDTHLRRTFKATTGQTIHAYVEGIRLARAKAMLLTTKLPMKVISHRLGFSHPGSFSSAFRDATGQCPRAVRREGPNA
jgi:AraC family transcriptional regulator